MELVISQWESLLNFALENYEQAKEEVNKELIENLFEVALQVTRFHLSEVSISQNFKN